MPILGRNIIICLFCFPWDGFLAQHQARYFTYSCSFIESAASARRVIITCFATSRSSTSINTGCEVGSKSAIQDVDACRLLKVANYLKCSTYVWVSLVISHYSSGYIPLVVLYFPSSALQLHGFAWAATALSFTAKRARIRRRFGKVILLWRGCEKLGNRMDQLGILG